MGERSLLSARPATRTITAAVDVVLLTPRDGSLAALLLRTADPRARERWLLPWDAPRLDESPEDAGQRVARSVLGAPPAALDQIGASDSLSDRKSTRLNSSHLVISYAVFCLKKK